MPAKLRAKLRAKRYRYHISGKFWDAHANTYRPPSQLFPITQTTIDLTFAEATIVAHNPQQALRRFSAVYGTPSLYELQQTPLVAGTSGRPALTNPDK